VKVLDLKIAETTGTELFLRRFTGINQGNYVGGSKYRCLQKGKFSSCPHQCVDILLLQKVD